MECTTFSNKRTTQLLLRVHGYHSDRVSVGVVGPGIRRSGCVRSLANSDRRTVRPYKAYGKVFIAHSALILESERVRLTETHKPSHMLSKDPPLTHTTNSTRFASQSAVVWRRWRKISWRVGGAIGIIIHFAHTQDRVA